MTDHFFKPTAAHDRCEACGIYGGKTNFVEKIRIDNFRDHDLCSNCIEVWNNLDGVLKQKTSWEQLLMADKVMYRLMKED